MACRLPARGCCRAFGRTFQPYWFETGTPTFLVRLLTERCFFTPDLSRLHSSLALLSSFDVDRITPEALLFQTGYLTVHAAREPLPGRWICWRPSRATTPACSIAISRRWGLDIRVEDTTNHGRIDMVVRFRGQVFVFEFKVVEHAATGEALHLVGVEFGRAARNLVGFEVETLPS